MSHFFYVALGGAIGASLRHMINLMTLRTLGAHFPWGTLTANVLGSFAMGVFV
ncbi:MAG: CrcB family protein, partial [Pseudomonadota bacterium]